MSLSLENDSQQYTLPLEVDQQSFIMVSGRRQILGLVLAISGFLGTIIICLLPTWKVTTLSTFGIATVIWEGVWMDCVTYSTDKRKCKVYDSLHAFPEDLQAARAFIIVAIIAGLLGILLDMVVGKCTKLVEDERQKNKVAITSGVIIMLAGLMVLIPICWTTNDIRHFDNAIMIDYFHRKELGASLYIGWGCAALLIMGGSLLCSNCPPPDENGYDVRYSKARSIESSTAYVLV